MHLLSIALCGLALAAAVVAGSGAMQPKEPGIRVSSSADRKTGPGPADYFTGTVRVEMLFEAQAPARASGGRVRFEPGARTAWHTHPLGQILIVTEGTGWVQEWGGPKREIRPGDVVRIAPGVKHWHGATATSAMTHIAIQENLDGRVVEWMEKVSEEDYLRQ
ncbi:MAG: cupin domain-containing protein [Bryobacteraceae bacterium]|nr:cupin domain-containing protein [Bryobacteraceae bacterium]